MHLKPSISAQLRTATMFEKSLYDLIRGLRNHKGNEREYIQNSLRECRAEIRGSDMDLKATALLKLIYLEMFGHDMSWASFHVLEVMSSAKYLQKRVGYLGAVQSFRPDTEVLMLATNLLKKDISSPSVPTITLPLVTLPHVITSSLAMSLLSDLLPRLSHSNPNVRKKTVVALYRLALAYPETLRPAWPKIKDLLTSEDEDSSVTAAVINVVCELGWRRPRDFLPLAPRLFELLVDGGNNWMAIKIIKLFATLTPLEPRLVKKLLPPLATLIRTTPAMSLLYECINGIIQGGILESVDGIREGEEIAALCVSKLRGMIVVEGDPNLKYVALLAFKKIVLSHPDLVSHHRDVIMDCIEDLDVSIRLQALELSAGMVNKANLIDLVDRLLRQLRQMPSTSDMANRGCNSALRIEPAADSDGEDPELVLRLTKDSNEDGSVLPSRYRIAIIEQILDICAKNTYANISDFEWYISVLVQLVGLVPAESSTGSESGGTSDAQTSVTHTTGEEISAHIGRELRNVAVRVISVRPEAVRAAASLVLAVVNQTSNVVVGSTSSGALRFAAWIVGEYAEQLDDLDGMLSVLTHSKVVTLSSATLSAYLQAIPKVLVIIISRASGEWNRASQSVMSLLLARILYFLEPLTAKPSLEVQERAVELAELIRVASQAVADHSNYSDHWPLLLTKAIPQLFGGMNINPVAPSAQGRIPLPTDIDLDIPFSSNLASVLQGATAGISPDSEAEDFARFYTQRPAGSESEDQTMASRLIVPGPEASSYQTSEEANTDTSLLTRKRFERRLKNKDDPFYIAGEDISSGASTPFHDIIKNTNGDGVDVDSIPIMNLDLGDRVVSHGSAEVSNAPSKTRLAKNYQIAMDENIDVDNVSDFPLEAGSSGQARMGKASKKSLLQVDSSGLGGLALEGTSSGVGAGTEGHSLEDAEMIKAVQEVERLRLEMQRASERVPLSQDISPEGTLVKKKQKRVKKAPRTDAEITRGEEALPGGRKHDGHVVASNVEGDAPVIKRKKRRKADVIPG
ncbi:AP-3 complex subunit delta [Xanthoria calcicola]